MEGEAQTRLRQHYLELAAVARGNAARCTEPEMRDQFLDVASVWQLMADEISPGVEQGAPQSQVSSSVRRPIVQR